MPTGIPYANEAVNAKKRDGSRNNNWRGGRHISKHGYVKVLVGIGHHLADSKGYAYEHRLVAEHKLGRRLKPEEKIHHIDGDKINNKESNIKIVVGNGEHYFEHRDPNSELRKPHEPNPIILCCCGCGTQFTKFDGQGRPRRFVSGHNGRLQNGRYRDSLL